MTGELTFNGSDVHSHLQDANGDGSATLRLVLERARRAKIKRILCSATNPDDFEAVRKIGLISGSGNFPHIPTTFGVHPWFCQKIKGREWEESLLYYLNESNSEREERFLPGVGEIGLDFALRGLDDEGKGIQREFFRRQLEMAQRLKRPVILHSVRTADEIGETLRSFPEIPLILFHGFAGSLGETNGEDERVFFSFSEREVRSERRKGFFAAVAPDQILLESDFPSTRSEPADLLKTGERIAELLGVPNKELLAKIRQNEEKFFDRWPRRKG